ncbi:hypothetical protein [Paenibacillus illinoisensis]|uniref:hypothetical protein n=1 Tax=Paenibacillus illinoisensis TaxID=59845 RepID=UPI003D97D033
MNEPGLEKVMDTLNQDFEARQKYLHDETSMLEGARKAGIKSGITEVAKNMLDLNLDISTIAKATGMTEQEIIHLKR